MKKETIKILIANKYILSRWLIFLILSFLFYLSCVLSLKLAGMTIIVQKLIISTICFFVFGIVICAFYYRAFIYLVKIKNETIIHSNILKTHKINLSDIVFLDIDYKQMQALITYKTNNSKTALLKFSLIDLQQNYKKYKTIMQFLIQSANADSTTRYNNFLLFKDTDINSCIKNHMKSEGCIFATYFVFNLRNGLPGLYLLIILFSLNNAPAIFPLESFFITNGIFIFSELIFILTCLSYFNSSKMTADKFKKQFKLITLIRHFLLLISLLIGAVYLSAYPKNLIPLASISSLMYFILYYYMSIGMFRKNMKNYASSFQYQHEKGIE